MDAGLAGAQFEDREAEVCVWQLLRDLIREPKARIEAREVGKSRHEGGVESADAVTDSRAPSDLPPNPPRSVLLDPDAEEAWAAEITKRAESVARGEAKLVAWDDVDAEAALPC